MTEKQIAKRIQHIIDCYDPMDGDLADDLCKLRDELDPPKPEHVWVKFHNDNNWYLGVRGSSGIKVADPCPSDEIEAVKPARILAPDEVVAKKASEFSHDSFLELVSWATSRFGGVDTFDVRDFINEVHRITCAEAQEMRR